MAARTSLQALAGLPAAREDREDPWWTYEVSAVLDVEDLFNKLLAIAAQDLRK